MAAREEEDAASKRKATEEDSSPDQASDQKADEAVAPAAEVDGCSDDEADPVIRNLNLMSKMDVMTPEWTENRKKQYYEDIDLYNRAYDALENGDISSSDDEADVAEYEEWSKRLWASVDWSDLNTVGGESRGMDAVAVYPDGVYPQPKEDEAHDVAAPAAESSS